MENMNLEISLAVYHHAGQDVNLEGELSPFWARSNHYAASGDLALSHGGTMGEHTLRHCGLEGW